MELKKINITWKSIESLCKLISISIRNFESFTHIRFDTIISIGRGGMVPSRILSEYLGINTVYLLNFKSYDGTKSSTQSIEPLNKNIDGKNVLLVDDCMTTGNTLEACLKHCNDYYPNSIKTCCLFQNKKLLNTSTFYGKMYNGETEWLVFPWEKTINV